jgi:hypothetical protein
VRKGVTAIGIWILALLPVAAAVSPDAIVQSAVPVAFTQPLALPVAPNRRVPILSESGVLLLVGSALFGLAWIVKKTTKV